MKLLVVTQKVDKNDPVLGFFHNWLFKLAPKFERISAICLQEGVSDLPKNVKIFSLGKESLAKSLELGAWSWQKIKYVWNFYKYIWQFRSEYDAVFVHMNQEYILLGGLFWKLSGKKIYFWRNHPKGSWLTEIAVWFSERVFCTSTHSFTAKFKKTEILPAGIDTDLFFIDNKVPVLPNSILSLGRISPIKNIDKIVELAFALDKEGVDFVLDIVGDPVNPEDCQYLEKLVARSKILNDKGKINFISAVSQEGAALMFKSHEIFLNLTPSGSMDKTILEAAASGSIPIVTNKFFSGIFEEKMITSGEPADLLSKIVYWLKIDPVSRRNTSTKMIDYVIEQHSLSALIGQMSKIIK
jgi:glycosyltransferase involved in cell wall biosynthesis